MIPIPKRLILVAGVIVVIAVVLFAFVIPILFPNSSLKTSIAVVDPQGVSHNVMASNQAAFPTVNGIQISSIVITTSFIAQSPNYAQYTLISGSAVTLTQTTGAITSKGTAWAVSLLYNFGGGLIGTCGSQLVPFAAGSTPYNVGTNYYLGGGISTTNTPVFSINAQTLMQWSSANGCPGSGSFTLAYSVQVTVQAAGTGSLPTATYVALYDVPVNVVTGTISLTGSTWGTSQ